MQPSELFSNTGFSTAQQIYLDVESDRKHITGRSLRNNSKIVTGFLFVPSGVGVGAGWGDGHDKFGPRVGLIAIRENHNPGLPISRGRADHSIEEA